MRTIIVIAALVFLVVPVHAQAPPSLDIATLMVTVQRVDILQDNMRCFGATQQQILDRLARIEERMNGVLWLMGVVIVSAVANIFSTLRQRKYHNDQTNNGGKKR